MKCCRYTITAESVSKKTENRSIFGEVMSKSKESCFLTHEYFHYRFLLLRTLNIIGQRINANTLLSEIEMRLERFSVE